MLAPLAAGLELVQRFLLQRQQQRQAAAGHQPAAVQQHSNPLAQLRQQAVERRQEEGVAVREPRPTTSGGGSLNRAQPTAAAAAAAVAEAVGYGAGAGATSAATSAARRGRHAAAGTVGAARPGSAAYPAAFTNPLALESAEEGQWGRLGGPSPRPGRPPSLFGTAAALAPGEPASRAALPAGMGSLSTATSLQQAPPPGGRPAPRSGALSSAASLQLPAQQQQRAGQLPSRHSAGSYPSAPVAALASTGCGRLESGAADALAALEEAGGAADESVASQRQARAAAASAGSAAAGGPTAMPWDAVSRFEGQAEAAAEEEATAAIGHHQHQHQCQQSESSHPGDSSASLSSAEDQPQRLGPAPVDTVFGALLASLHRAGYERAHEEHGGGSAAAQAATGTTGSAEG